LKTFTSAFSFALSTIAVATLAVSAPALAGDPVVGKQKATACIACHGSDTYPGIFYTLQLAGRNADKLTVKTMKYKTGKILHPMMNLSTSFFNEKEIEDISAYYQSLGKPSFTSVLFKIKGDDDESSMAPAPYAYPAFSAFPVYPALPANPAPVR
jgi:cytochrome c553